MRFKVWAALATAVAMLISSWAALPPAPVQAQSGCALRINEIMYDPASGWDADARAEWVELYVAADITTDTTFFITDQEAAAVGIFEKAFIVPGGTVAGSYVVIHNDGNPANDGAISNTGIYITLSFYMGNAATKLLNGGDDIVLYQGSAVDGVPCDYVEYLDGDPSSNMPVGFSWDAGCGNPGSSQDFGTSIALDPDGAASNSSCDWTESGLDSPNNPGLPATNAPDSMGWSNNTTPTAVSLASFSAAGAENGRFALPLTALLLAGLTFWWARTERARTERARTEQRRSTFLKR